MLNLQSDLHGNHLLRALPLEEWQALAPDLEIIELRAGQVLCNAHDSFLHVYFPASAVISLSHALDGNCSVEIATVGREGMVGVPVLTEGDTMPTMVTVECSGTAYRMDAHLLREHLQRSRLLDRLSMLYIHAFFTQIAQNAACNRYHSLSSQLCRWLLVGLDRASSNQLRVTQQHIADLLGVRREGVTEAVGRLHSHGVVYQTRGCIRVLDRKALEARACECYGLIKAEFNRLLPATITTP
ncbi:Crp/Fnr family transcriptional regulator [Caballeronia sp. LP006]|jgi:CRP-like cAMP-binding protein|uniref:Crp/Fnr family transcriptional regulator n=1 Tax=unclassified Caballeronia TaxID=2646786 RepID=UPI001FD3C3B6|nr:MULTISPECIES: Crp/Fnr family transcriptional regulator [unclassified Caballeronia]MDR5774456.1 Crp/Fnr family transcriptional regulator [Caballeronia sp. LZ002]MDR5805986.1 Crp/Fnr family transcriptional regulator [Caballeronia sp. LZ001]MDR5826440.1 Crp/Fnr family transcriptional regulator [Caballeronia sp. LP006]MDR5849891.1 Crp/Fnr family transcriptional regulator [Caballeronia sp. LZ003]